jgi:hypothetical protein
MPDAAPAFTQKDFHHLWPRKTLLTGFQVWPGSGYESVSLDLRSSAEVYQFRTMIQVDLHSCVVTPFFWQSMGQLAVTTEESFTSLLDSHTVTSFWHRHVDATLLRISHLLEHSIPLPFFSCCLAHTVIGHQQPGRNHPEILTAPIPIIRFGTLDQFHKFRTNSSGLNALLGGKNCRPHSSNNAQLVARGLPLGLLTGSVLGLGRTNIAEVYQYPVVGC